MSAENASARPRDEPEGYSQEEQLKALRADKHADVYFDTSETEEEATLTGLFGHHDPHGLYHAPGEDGGNHEGGETS